MCFLSKLAEAWQSPFMAASRSPRPLLKDALASVKRLAKIFDLHADTRDHVHRAIASDELAAMLALRVPMAEAIERRSDAGPAALDNT